MKFIIAAAAGLFLLIFILSVYYFRRTVLRRPPMSDSRKAKLKNTPAGRYGDRLVACAHAFDAMPCERIHMQSFDGLQLSARWFRAENPRGTLVMMHGYHSGAAFDFGCVAPFLLHDMQLNLLIPDQRAHGESEGDYITFGVKERFDCRDWAIRAETLGEGLPVILYGLSMGAATVLMASGLDLPASVAGIAADCGFTSPRAIFAHVLHDNMHLPEFPLLPVVGWMTKTFAGFSLDGASTLTALQKNTLPVLLIHGEDDTYVPPEMSRQNYDACRGERMLLTVAGAEHAVSYLVAEEACRQKITAFFDLCIGQK